INSQIKSRLDDEKHSYFVATLLTYGVVDTNLEQVYDKEDSLYDFLLIDILANRLMEAIPKGYYKRYHRFDNNDDRLKGSIDIARNIRLNLGQVNGRIAYSYRENTINNTFNAFILKTYHYIK